MMSNDDSFKFSSNARLDGMEQKAVSYQLSTQDQLPKADCCC